MWPICPHFRCDGEVSSTHTEGILQGLSPWPNFWAGNICWHLLCGRHFTTQLHGRKKFMELEQEVRVPGTPSQVLPQCQHSGQVSSQGGDETAQPGKRDFGSRKCSWRRVMLQRVL